MSKARTTAAAAAAMSWLELETFTSNVFTRPDPASGPTNSRATFRSFDSSSTDPTSARVVLYRDNHAWCPYCQKIWLWLEEKRIPYRIEKITMFCYGEKESWYKKLVPSGMLPALALDGQIITESDDILVSLENEFGPLGGQGMNDTNVLHLRRMERQLFRAWCQWLCYPARSSRDETTNQSNFVSTANIVDAQLKQTAGPYFLGEELCTADVIFTPYIERMAASLFYYKGYDMKSNHPHIRRWFEAMETRPAYVGTQR